MNPNRLLCCLLLTAVTTVTHAQTKVFKDVVEGISTQMMTITQDNALVGYIAFTRLEKTDVDSFNYQLTIMDENLNDIGTVRFRQRSLRLQAVSFEQDIICLGYVETSISGLVLAKKAREANRNTGRQDDILLQFISLDGKTLKMFKNPVQLTGTGNIGSPLIKLYGEGFLMHDIQMKNIPGKGFAVFYGDDIHRELLFLDTKGNLLRKTEVREDAPSYSLQASQSAAYILLKARVDAPEGGYKLDGYSANDSTKDWTIVLKDRQNNWLKVLSIDRDPLTGRIFLAGCIINPDRARGYLTARDYSKKPYLGLFTMILGATRQDVESIYSYWATGTMPGMDENGLFTDSSYYGKYSTAFRDFSSNTMFVGSGLFVKKFNGTSSYRLSEAIFVTQNAKGRLRLNSLLPCDHTYLFNAGGQLYELDHKSFYRVTNPEVHTDFMIVDDKENTYVYNINSKKLVRTIQHNEGHINTRILPAKEGHIMVSEYNSKEKTTRFSIEAL